MADCGIIFLRRRYIIHWYQLLHPHIVGSMPFRFIGPPCIIDVQIIVIASKGVLIITLHVRAMFLVVMGINLMSKLVPSPPNCTIKPKWWIDLSDIVLKVIYAKKILSNTCDVLFLKRCPSNINDCHKSLKVFALFHGQNKIVAGFNLLCPITHLTVKLPFVQHNGKYILYWYITWHAWSRFEIFGI